MVVRFTLGGDSIESMNTYPIIDTVSLTVRNLESSLDFYQTKLGFHIHDRNGNSAGLGSPDRAFLNLVENPMAKRIPGTAGLYHFAVLLPSRPDLARILVELIEARTPLQGLSDHGVSEAIYLPDPDGNGIEIYRDRPEEEWPKQGSQLEMVTDPMDVDSLLALSDKSTFENLGLPAGTVLGHMHLHVGEIAEAEAFYSGVLGFDLMQRYGPTASFLSINGYHHHVGVNTWNGVGIPPAPEGALGLRWFSMRLAENGISERLRDADVEFSEGPEGPYVLDPSGNKILILDGA